MRYLKMLTLLMVGASALVGMLSVGTASALTLCKTNVTTGCSAAWHYPTGTTIHFTASGSWKVSSGSTTLDTCTGVTKRDKTTSTGSDGGNSVTMLEEETAYTGCTFSTTSITNGSEEFQHVTGTDEATDTGNGSEVTINTGFFGSCNYGTTNTDLGKFVAGNPAEGTTNSTVPLKKNESGLCPSSATLSTTWIITSPKPLYFTD